MAVEIVLLGEVSARVDGRPVDLGPSRQRCVLAALAVDAGRLVPADRLVERVWGADTPRRGRATLHSHVSRLRKAFGGALAVVHRSDGYVLEVEADQTVDLLRFQALRDRARRADGASQVAPLTEALALWHGEPFSGVSGEWVEGERDRWQQERWAAEHDLTDVLLRLGQGEELVAELSARAARHPLDERVAGQFMLALHRAGRTADALAHYRHVWDRLAEDLGTDPGAALQELHQRILDTDPALTSPAAALGARTAPVPRQLPAPPRWFTGRAAELARLDETLAGINTVLISAIGGAGGIGKTWLALRWAHQHAERFPDGQLFVDLRGFNPTEEPMAPESAMRGFLDALGVDSGRIPPALDAQAALFRSLVADRRMLIVLDNAATAEQVVPLLPGSPACTVLVTGRTRLVSLLDRHGARHLQLDALPGAEARALLAARLGAGRVAAEPAAVDELVELCGGYPLALSITARNAVTRPGTPLAEVAAELRELGLATLDHDTDPAASLPAVLSWSLRRLTGEQRTVFGLLGVAPGPDTTLPAVAALTGLASARARKALAALEEASLLERQPGGRYAMHDLVRAYAATTAHDLPDDEREAALVRVMDFCLHTACAADRLLEPQRPLVQPDPPAAGVHPLPLADTAAATTWLRAERATFLATQRVAASLRRHHVVWHLAWALNTFHLRQAHRHDGIAAWRAALEAAAHLPDTPFFRTCAHRHLGYACAQLGLREEAATHLDQALSLAAQQNDATEQAHTHLILTYVREGWGDSRKALEHARQALDHYQSLGNPLWEAEALNAAGWCAAQLGDLDSARDHCGAALALQRHHRFTEGEATTLDSLGLIAHRAGDHRQALDHYDEALARYRTLGNAYQVANTLENLGHPHAAIGQDDQARKTWQEALELFREQGRDNDAERVRRQLDALEERSHTAGR
ncbi:AfsR/SARP family transcriptional regulator [Lentzea nigeriaca]|uniref:AfsR/SARP family transcriptional regulator n=1 Tax=Lentzea nigeriaca TaxID=1128665 RepID=UPI0019562839|nr:BTAD domain-containing putative transcriptional regulator [Lentzea nigeriaca]MBM7858809.1 DNA-binding SARP family transcriptional activator/tetratricopeptide (TPR) repeat protein [Lentzea nigeriaca]